MSSLASPGCQPCAAGVKHTHSPEADRDCPSCGGSGHVMRGSCRSTCRCVLNPAPKPGHVNPTFTLEDPATAEVQQGSIVRELHGRRRTGRVIGFRGDRLLLDNGTQPRLADVLVVRS